MSKLALTGGAYEARSLIASAQRAVNLVAEPLPEGQGEPSRAAHYPTPGTRLLSSIGPGPIRAVRQATTGGVYVVSGSEVHSVNTSSWAGTLLGSITSGLRRPVSMVDNGLDLVIVDGTANGWQVGLAGNTFAQISDPTGMFAGADRVDYLDTYFLFNKPHTPQFYISGSLAVDFDPLDFANKSTYPDLLVTLAVAKRELYLLGERTTEIWYDAGATDIGAGSFPFAQTQGVFIDHGIVAKYSVANYDNGLFWLSRDRQGQGIVLTAADYKTKRVSTYAIEAEIAGYSRIDDAVGFCYALGGHAFYVLTFPHADHTWVYDITTGLWHEWVWLDSNGDEHRHRSNCHAAIAGMNVVGDWQNGNLYALDNHVFTDNGSPIKRLRSFPHILADGKRVFYRQFLADIETGTAPTMLGGTLTLLDASFTADDYTKLEDYTSEVGGGWAAVSGEANGEIIGNALVGTGGEALYASTVVLPTPDYLLRFSVVPPAYDVVPTATSVWAIGRATALGEGYRAKVAADGVQYTLSIAAGGGASASVSMGTLTSGSYTVTLTLRASTITAQVQRTQDALYLGGDGAWRAGVGTIAAQLTDATYAAAGHIVIGGTWPTPGLVATLETILSPDPNFPSGYAHSPTFQGQTFDWARKLQYQGIYGAPNGGIAITDLSTMRVIRTVTLAQMYAGTPYGLPAGSPPSQDIFDLTCGSGTDLYMLTAGDPAISPPNKYQRLARVDPVTLKVTGEFYLSTGFPPPIKCISGDAGVVNTTATRTIVVYPSNEALGLGPEIMDGTGMAPIGLGPTPIHNAYQIQVIAGARRANGSCDFIMLNPDWIGTTGDIHIWRINVADNLVVTSTMGTLNVFPTIPGITKAQLAQAEYDVTHDTIILYVSGSDSAPLGEPIYLFSVNYDGTVNWTRGPLNEVGNPDGKGQSRLTGSTLMLGRTAPLTMLDTGTGETVFTGDVLVAGSSAGSFYRVYDAERREYFTYALSRGFVRVALSTALAMDNLLVTTDTVPLADNLISLESSDDRGHSWGSPVSQPIGAAGEYRKSLQWRRLGVARNRCFRLSWAAAVPTALQGCWLDAEPGDGGQEKK